LLAESSKRFDETLIADLQTGADAFGGARLGRLAEQGEDLIRERIARHEIRAIERGCQFQIWPRFHVRQFQRQRTNASGGAVFSGKHQLAVVSAQVEKRIDPGIQIGGAS